jgi:hypothetical protein
LTQDLNLLGTKALDEYVSQRSAVRSPRERFERLVGESLDEFETHWRQAMLGGEQEVAWPGLQPAGRPPADWLRAELPRPRPEN